MNHNKVIFLGESGVGKTSIITRRRYGTFNYEMTPTIGVGYELIDEPYDNHVVQLYLWDTAGQEQFNSIVPIYCQEAKIAIIVASFTDASSIKEIDKWNKFCDDSNDHPLVIVVINKIDIAPEETLNSIKEEIRQKFESFFCVSAKTGSGIDELFSFIAKTMYEMTVDTNSQISYHTVEIAEKNKDQKKQKSCC